MLSQLTHRQFLCIENAYSCYVDALTIGIYWNTIRRSMVSLFFQVVPLINEFPILDRWTDDF